MIPVIFWHYIISEKTSSLLAGLQAEKCSLDRFKEQLKEISTKGIKVISFDVLLNKLTTGQDLQGQVALSFDDGTKDHYQVVFPLLKKMGITAAFFPITAPLSGKIPLTFKLQIILGQGRAKKVREIILPKVLQELDLQDKLDNLEVPKERFRYESNQSAREVKWLCNYLLSPDQKIEVAERLFKALFAGQEQDLASKIFLNQKEIKEMAGAGMHIGSQTVNHHALAILNDSQIYQELNDSKKVLEAIIERPIVSFCYPSAEPIGGKAEQVQAMLKQLGCQFAFGDSPVLKDIDKNLLSLQRFHERDWRDLLKAIKKP